MDRKVVIAVEIPPNPPLKKGGKVGGYRALRFACQLWFGTA